MSPDLRIIIRHNFQSFLGLNWTLFCKQRSCILPRSLRVPGHVYVQSNTEGLKNIYTQLYINRYPYKLGSNNYIWAFCIFGFFAFLKVVGLFYFTMPVFVGIDN